MTTTAGTSLWDTLDHTPSPRQRNYLRYFTATLVDLVVLGLFAEYWEYVSVSSFTIVLLAAVLFQVLLKLALALEHRTAAFFNARPGVFNKCMRFFAAWLLVFVSKLLILGVFVLVFGDLLRFSGPFHGAVALITVVTVMLVVEAALVKFYRSLS